MIRRPFRIRKLLPIFGPWRFPATYLPVQSIKANDTKVCLGLKTRSMSSHDTNEMWGNYKYSKDYKGYLRQKDRAWEAYLNRPDRFQKISEREDRSDLPPEALQGQFMGKHFITHRGCSLLKSPDDMIIFQQLFWNLRPATVIELGTFTGGSAIWIADTLRQMEIECHIYSMDIDLSMIEVQVKKLQPDNVIFLEGDSNAIEKTFTEKFLSNAPHPWVVIEDAHTNIYGVLKHFGRFMKRGDYFVVEDLNPQLPRQVGFGRVYPEYRYEPAGMLGLRELKRFLSDYSQDYAVDSAYTDLFGYNATHNWHGYVRQM